MCKFTNSDKTLTEWVPSLTTGDLLRIKKLPFFIEYRQMTSKSHSSIFLPERARLGAFIAAFSLIVLWGGMNGPTSWAQEAGDVAVAEQADGGDVAIGLDQKIDQAFRPVADWWGELVTYPVSVGGKKVPVVVLVLVIGASFFTIFFGFINLRFIPFAIRVVSGKYDDIEKEGAADVKPSVANVDGDLVDTIRDEGEGEVSHFQALATAVSGTVGLGNISGVAVAIATGGPGATFWMIVCGLLGMSTKFVECTLGVSFREIDENGTVHGGPMYYLKKGLTGLGLAPVGLVLGIIFAVLCVGASFGGGNMFQANQATQQIKTLLGIDDPAAGTVIGIVMAILVAIVIIGGIKRIAKITEKIVPLMAVIYVAAALIIILMNIADVPTAVQQIISGAFTPAAGFGGLLGVLIVGFQRAAFSNEAGAGSAAIAHSAVKTNYPASEGVVALLEPFIDTVIICTMTALVIVLFNITPDDRGYLFEYGDVVDKEVLVVTADTPDGERVGGVDLTSRAFDSVLPGFRYVLTIAIILFAFSSMISWSYYGLQSWKYLFGRSTLSDMSYKILFCVFVVIGSAASLGAVIDFSDAMILALVFPNMIGLMLLFPTVRKELKRYLQAVRGK